MTGAALRGRVAIVFGSATGIGAASARTLARNHLTPYIGEPQDIANVVAFLAGDDSRFVTGHLFSVDGGLSAHQGMYADLVGDVA
jgi:NAD(P)-dependent dehydrogenase (short-subunit alcohol dehydrogenase family)